MRPGEADPEGGVMRVSVAMPVYNAGPYLREAIESMLDQTLREFEFIIIDDGSTDESRAIIEDYAQRDGRIRMISRPNRGITPTRNEALGLAQGECVAVMDADDVSLPDRLALQTAYLDAHPECLAVGGRILIVDAEGWPIREACTHEAHEDIDRFHMQGQGGALAHPASMFRREAALAIGGYREAFAAGEDLDLFLRFAERGKLANVPQCVLKYRQHSRSVSHARADVTRRCTEAVLRDAYARRNLPEPGDSLLQVDEAPLSLAAQHLKWAWWALDAGHVATARKHACRALFREPFRVGSWRAAFCAWRGR